jgi:hypothetical protein
MHDARGPGHVHGPLRALPAGAAEGGPLRQPRTRAVRSSRTAVVHGGSVIQVHVRKFMRGAGGAE